MTTYNEAGRSQLTRLCEALDLAQKAEPWLQLQRFMFNPWGRREIPEEAPFPSWIADDYSPFEYSIAFGSAETELRVLLECQGTKPTLQSNQQAGLELNRRLAQFIDVDLTRFDLIKDLFLPSDPCPPFSLWHAVCFRGDGRPDFKIYVNPQVRGVDQAEELVTEALKRLGFDKTAQLLRQRPAARQRELDELKYFSLDLSNKPGARVKVYFRHHHVTARELDAAFTFAPRHQNGDAIEYCAAMAGNEGPYMNKPVGSCFAFVEGTPEPMSVTLHFPISHYVQSDLIGVQRMARYLQKEQLDSSAYMRAVKSFDVPSLSERSGLLSYTSYRREAGGKRLTAYLSPELYERARLPAYHSGTQRRANKALSERPSKAKNGSRR